MRWAEIIRQELLTVCFACDFDKTVYYFNLSTPNVNYN